MCRDPRTIVITTRSITVQEIDLYLKKKKVESLTKIYTQIL